MADLVQQMRDDLNIHGHALTQPRLEMMAEAIDGLESSYQLLLTKASGDVTFAGSISFDLLMLCGYVCGAWQMVRSASLVASEQNQQFKDNKLATVNYFLDHLLPRSEGHRRSIVCGSESAMAISADNL